MVAPATPAKLSVLRTGTDAAPPVVESLTWVSDDEADEVAAAAVEAAPEAAETAAVATLPVPVKTFKADSMYCDSMLDA